MKPFACLLCHRADVPHSRAKRDLCEDCYDGLGVRGLAWCSRGKHRVTATELRPDGKRTVNCRACVNARNRARRCNEAQAARLRRWRARNPVAVARDNAQRRVRYARQKIAAWRGAL